MAKRKIIEKLAGVSESGNGRRRRQNGVSINNGGGGKIISAWHQQWQ
jgi:hypothetical protein